MTKREFLNTIATAEDMPLNWLNSPHTSWK